MLIKIANSEFILDASHQLSAEKALASPEITGRFKKLASEIKKVAPRSGDFLYFIARGIHAMEHAAIDPVTRQYNAKLGHIAYNDGKGSCKACGTHLLKTSSGDPIEGLWCSASQVEPWINQNGDAFPEDELLAEVPDPQDSTRKIRAYQTFIGKGLFTDHKSSEVENIRGIILDAAYDSSTKGVDLLIALDKVNYPELARQVSAGYSAQVSMGCQVNLSHCSICGNKAVTEHDYCNHVKQGKAIARAGQPRCYEINKGLNFIELSVVGTAADPRARIRTIVAHAQNIRKNLEANLQTTDAQNENQLILESLNRLEQQIGDIQSQVDSSTSEQSPIIASSAQEIINKIANLEQQIKDIGGRFMAQKTQNKKAYMQGTVEPEVGKTFDMSDKDYHQYWEGDKHLHGQGMDEGPEGLHSGYGMGSDEEVKKTYLRASMQERKKARKALLEKAAYMQGTTEPEVGKTFDMSDKDYHQYWEEDKHLHGQGMESGSDGLHPGYGLGSDENVKKELLRAKLRAKLQKFAKSSKNTWTVFAGEQPVLSLSAEQAYGSALTSPAEEVDSGLTNQQWFDSKDYGINLVRAVKQLGIEKVASEIASAKRVNAQAAPAAPAPAAPAMDASAPAPAAPEMPAAEGQPEMSAAEGIKAAAERIESAKDEILSLVDTLDGAPAAEGEALAGDLGAASEELGDLGTEMDAASQLPPAAASAFKKLTRQALNHASLLLKKAEAFAIKIAKEDEEDEKDDDKEDKEEDTVEIEVKDADKEDVKVKEAKLSTRELQARKTARMKLAQQIYNLTEGDMTAEAHPDGGNETTFPNQPKGKIETGTEAQKADIEVANSIPRGELVARKNRRNQLLKAANLVLAAETTQQAMQVDQAKAKADEMAEQLANNLKNQSGNKMMGKKEKKAAVDNETKQYYKEEASQSATGQKPDPEVGKFYSELTQDFTNKKATVAVHDYGLKMKRAFQVALRRANLGQIESSHEAVEADVDRLMKLDDESFQAFSQLVENTKKAAVSTKPAAKQVRTAGALNVGVDPKPESMVDILSKLPWKS